MLYVGIDPGERWCGMALLALRSDGSADVDARVYDVTKHGGYLGMTKDLIDILPHNSPTTFVVEDFRIRTIGHQKFNHGNTLRMLGALEYAVSKVRAFDWVLMPPGDHSEATDLFDRPLWSYVARWSAQSEQWHHCLSAWRVIGHHLMARQRATLLTLRACHVLRAIPRFIPVVGGRGDLIAPPMSWTLPKWAKPSKKARRHKARP